MTQCISKSTGGGDSHMPSKVVGVLKGHTREVSLSERVGTWRPMGV